MIDLKKQVRKEDLIKISEYVYEIAQSFRADMRVPARFFANEAMLDDLLSDRALWQLVNVATLPGIQEYAFGMPDMHQGYGFPIGGVAAMAIDADGVISPGGIGYDINCGVRLLCSTMMHEDIKKEVPLLATALQRIIPSGVGRGGRLKMDTHELDEILQGGAPYMVAQGYGIEDDVTHCEDGGVMAGAKPDRVSQQAKKRGSDQIGTLGSGNHFLEMQVVDEIFDEHAAQAMGLRKGLVTIMIHCGSRGLGHQVCTDYVRAMRAKNKEFGFDLPDMELVCAPFPSEIAQAYFAAMAASCNYAWANRHMIAHWTRKAWQEVLGRTAALHTVYDVSHNIGKRETHMVQGKQTQLLVHRKGATRAFGPHRQETPETYKAIGQPVFVPGTMGTASYVLVGTDASLDVAFGSCCHGAGRRMSRSQATQTVRGATVRKELEAQGIIVRSDSNAGLAEEAPLAYKDIEEVINVVHGAGLAKKVARLKPIAVIKGN